MVENNTPIVHLHKFREKKQLQGEEASFQLIDKVKRYSARHLNIREMVRAKHIFKLHLQLKEEDEIPSSLYQLFTDWLIFDYQTIHGVSVFQLFLQRQRNQMREYEMIQAALCMASVMEPLLITDYDGKTIIGYDLNEEEQVVSLNNVEHSSLTIEKGMVVFLRRIPGIKNDFAFTPFLLCPHVHFFIELRTNYQRMGKNDTLRSFLKHRALDILPERQYWEVVSQ
ncbi:MULTISPECIES: hypothetical protein [Cytobacillus]|uniref:Uncharacterized protein n=1 Tax=Cytobacillus stercorigallinarum TaxID=2762240 RepID=A0ABR8QJ97_9BACI|nr:hypothetical protein [Cytobacillus stercorigallinarum]MBD7935504.1 hypothetical protein [Cytobacillus stercorigallinarum]